MIRRVRDKSYTVKAYRIHGDKKELFWCTPINYKMITNEMGNPMSNGNKTFETDSDITFRNNDLIMIGDEPLRVESVEERINRNNLNSRRGNPSYIQTVTIR